MDTKKQRLEAFIHDRIRQSIELGACISIHEDQLKLIQLDPVQVSERLSELAVQTLGGVNDRLFDGDDWAIRVWLNPDQPKEFPFIMPLDSQIAAAEALVRACNGNIMVAFQALITPRCADASIIKMWTKVSKSPYP